MKTITGSFTSLERAEGALDALLAHKPGIIEIGLLLRDCQPGRQRSETVIEHVWIGAVAGAALGGFGGLAAGISNVAVPRNGMLAVIGAVLAVLGFVLAGAGAAALGGSFIGTLVGFDLSKTGTITHELGHLHFKDALVIVVTPDKQATAAENIMWQGQAIDVTSERTMQTGNGWLRFEEVTMVKVEEYPMS